jgi:hypothetical protein
MASATEEKDPFSFNIQLNTDEEYCGFQRPDVVDDYCLDLLLQGRIDRIVHGHETKDGNPATLIVFGFRFHGIDKNRRFKRAIVTILFQDERKRNRADPEVIALWPNGDFTLGEPTGITVDDTVGGDAGLNLTSGTIVQGGGNASRKWEQKKSYKKTDRASLTGSIILDTSIRESGKNNAVRLTINEDTTATSGLVTDFRAAVLLRRKNDTDNFLGTVKIKAEANILYNAIRGLRDISGFSPGNDPVKFKPSQQYLREATLSRFLKDKLAEHIDDENLNTAKLDGLAGVLGTTALATSI